MLLKPLMPCSIQLYETPSNSTNYMTIDDMQIPISDYQNVATKTKPKIENPTKISNPPNQKNTTQNTLGNLEKEIGMCTDQT